MFCSIFKALGVGAWFSSISFCFHSNFSFIVIYFVEIKNKSQKYILSMEFHFFLQIRMAGVCITKREAMEMN